VTIDDKPTPAALLGVERPVDPGVHHFAVHVGGQTRAAADLTIAEGQSYQVELDAHPAQPTAKPAAVSLQTQSAWSSLNSQKTLSYVGLGVGVVGLGVGTYTGLVALHYKSKLDSACNPGCPASSASDIDSWRSNRTASWLSYGVGVAAAGAGVLLLALGKPTEDQIAVRAMPNGFQIGGQL